MRNAARLAAAPAIAGRPTSRRASALVAGGVLAACALLTACTPAPLAPAAPESRWHAAGNEPFWSVDVEGRQAVFRTPEDIPGLALPARRVDDGTDVVFTEEEGAPPFLLRLRAEPCQDSMADRTWTHSATFSHGGTAYVGCAERLE